MSIDATRSIPTRGPFELRELALFGFGHQSATTFDGMMRMAFRLDGDLETACGVEVRQSGDHLDLRIHGSGDPDVAARQVARVLSCDHDGDAFAELGRRDPVIGRLQAVAPGLRPPLFYSPYEAAVWSVLSARRPRQQAIPLRERLNQAYGESLELAGQSVTVLPSPSALARVEAVQGLPHDRVPRLHAIAAAAVAGDLDIDRLVALGPEQAAVQVQRLPGIGPFYSALIVVRACGFTDVLPVDEPRSRALVERLYGLDGMSDEQYSALAEHWRPFRTWATVLIRAASGRLELV